MFRKPYEEHERYFIESGRRTADIYKHEINKKGIKELVKTGETNVYEKIQEALEETKIENIISRVVQGDTTMLRANGQYIDCTEIPNNLIEARQAIQKLENTWSELPNEVKKEYDYSVEKFITEAGTEKWMIDMGMIKKSETKAEETIVKPESKGEETE